MITMENVSKAYVEGIPAIKNISLHIDRGEFVFIVGDSGSGKSDTYQASFERTGAHQRQDYGERPESGASEAQADSPLPQEDRAWCSRISVC